MPLLKQKNQKTIYFFKTGLVLIFLAVIFLSGVKDSEALISEKINYQGKLTDDSNVTVADGAYDIVFNLYTTAGGGSPIWTESWTASALWTDTNPGTVARDDATCGGSGFTRVAYSTTTNEGTLAAGQSIWNMTLKESAIVSSVNTGSDYVCVYNPQNTWSAGDDVTNRIYVRSGIFSTMIGGVQSLSPVDFNQTLYLGVTIGADPEMKPRKVIGSVPSAFTAKTLNNNGSATVATTAGATLSMGNTTGAITMFSGGASSWANDTGNLTVSTTTSGTLAITSAGALNLLAASASTVTLANVVNSMNFDGNTLSIDALNNRVGIGITSPTGLLSLAGSTATTASLNIATGTAPTGGNLHDGDLWYEAGHLYFRDTTTKDLLASGSSQWVTNGTKIGYDLGNVGIGTTDPLALLAITGSTTARASLNIAAGAAPSSPNDGDLWYEAGHLYFRDTTTKDLLAGGGMAISGAITGATSGSVLFVNSSSQLAQDNANFFWNAGTASLGIGTTAPGAKLGILSTTEQLRLAYDATYYAKFTTANDSKLSIETSTSTQSMLTIGKGTAQDAGVSFDGNTNDYYSGMDDTTDKFMIGLGLVVGTTPYLTVEAAGDIGIGTTDPTAQLHTTGTVRFANFGAGTVSTDSSGNLSVSSDERLKTISGTFNRGLESLRGISPIIYRWNDASGMETENEYAGFSAQNIKTNIPEAVGTDSRGYLTLSDRPILAAAVVSIQQLDEKIGALFEATDGLDLAGLITSLKAQDAIFEKRITSLELELEEQKAQLAGLENSEPKQEDADILSGLDFSASDENIIASFGADMLLVQGAIDADQSRITGLEEEVGTIKNELSTLSEKEAKTMEGLSFTGENDLDETGLFEKVIEFLDSVTFRKAVVFEDSLFVSGGIEIAGEIVVGKDSAGYAIIKENSNRVKVVFEKEYRETPLVSATLSAGQEEDQELQEALEELILLSDIRFVVTNVTKSGFEIKINQPVSADIPFMWMAVSAKNPNTFLSEEAESAEDQMKTTIVLEEGTGENELPVENTDSPESMPVEEVDSSLPTSSISLNTNQTDNTVLVNSVE
jgi:hypothetical protein